MLQKVTFSVTQQQSKEIFLPRWKQLLDKCYNFYFPSVWKPISSAPIPQIYTDILLPTDEAFTINTSPCSSSQDVLLTPSASNSRTRLWHNKETKISNKIMVRTKYKKLILHWCLQDTYVIYKACFQKLTICAQ